MMKPYFGYFRNNYPESNNFFYAAHWWHPAIYEAQMIAGNGPAQPQVVMQTDKVLYGEVLKDRPLRMLLSREMMPRYSQMSPESANIFDNLHMLHGIAYDILAYEGWTIEEQKAEIYRVIDAMGYQPGDEKLAMKFSLASSPNGPASSCGLDEGHRRLDEPNHDGDDAGDDANDDAAGHVCGNAQAYDGPDAQETKAGHAGERDSSFSCMMQ